jgi:hypothetical protein
MLAVFMCYDVRILYAGICFFTFVLCLKIMPLELKKVVSQGCMHDASKVLTVGANALFTTISETLNHQNNIRLYQWPRGLVLRVILL